MTGSSAVSDMTNGKLASPSRYLLPSDKPESERLNLQNRVLKKAFGNVVFAPFTFSSDDAVLDVGTGTACWTLDCHDAFGTAHYYGIDITSDLFPILDVDLKSRIHLTEGNILRLQGEWADRSYTLVNQRLLIAALSAENWKTAINNIYKVLAPGGWVQFVETNHCRSGDVTDRHHVILRHTFEKRGLLFECAEKIPALLHDAGFVEINSMIYEINLGSWAGQDGVEARDTFIGVYKAMKYPVVDVMGIMSSPDFDSLIEQMQHEWDSTPGSKIVFHVLYARKSALP